MMGGRLRQRGRLLSDQDGRNQVRVVMKKLRGLCMDGLDGRNKKKSSAIAVSGRSRLQITENELLRL